MPVRLARLARLTRLAPLAPLAPLARVIAAAAFSSVLASACAASSAPKRAAAEDDAPARVDRARATPPVAGSGASASGATASSRGDAAATSQAERSSTGVAVVASGASGATGAAASPPSPASRARVELDPITVVAAPLLATFAPEPDLEAAMRPLLARDAQRAWDAYDAAKLAAGIEPADLWAEARRASARETCGPDDATASARATCGVDDATASARATTDAGARDASPLVPPPAAPRAAHDPDPKSAARLASARAQLARVLDAAIAAGPSRAPATVAAMVARASLDEEAAAEAERADDASRAATLRERAAATYRRAKEKGAIDAPPGWLARYRVAALEEPRAAEGEWDALLDVPLATPLARAWVRPLAARPLRDWSKAAGVLRAVALSATTPAERTGARAEWMVATWNAGGFDEALDLALGLLRAGDAPHVAIDVADRAIARRGGAEKVRLDLPPPAWAALMRHVAVRAWRAGALATAERAARAVVERAPESIEAKDAARVLASIAALRGRPPVSDEDRARALQARVAGLAERCLSHPRDAFGPRLDPPADGARIEFAIDGALTARAVGGGPLGPGLACLAARAPDYLASLPAAAHGVVVVATASSASAR